jgi:hypothetical protein
VLYRTVAQTAALCGRPALTKQTVKYKLFSSKGKKDRRIEQWSTHHPELAGHMAAMVIDWERGNGGASWAAKYLLDAAGYDLHLIEPRFGLLYVEHLAHIGRTAEARNIVTTLLGARKRDPAYDALELWSARLDQLLIATSRRQADPAPTKRQRMARPRDHVLPNPYRVYG